MRIPEFLRDNGTIGFVAPSFGCATEPYITGFNKALRKFESMGYKTHIGSNCSKGDGIGISTNPSDCGKELTSMYLFSDNDVLISCGGGELMCEILEYVDFEAIKNAPAKWFLGYSDNTNFTFLQNVLCDTAAIYGSCAAAFGMDRWHKALEDTFSVLTGKSKTISGYDMWEKESLKTEDNPTPEYNLTEKKQIKCYEGTKNVAQTIIEGRLLGGCMDILVNLLGTQYDKTTEFIEKYKEDGIVWFLESCDLNVFSIRRAMWQMDNAGWFKNAKGFIIGRPLCFGQDMMGLDQYEAVLGIIGKYDVPIIMDCDFGHLPPSMPIISGVKANIKADDNVYINYDI